MNPKSYLFISIMLSMLVFTFVLNSFDNLNPPEMIDETIWGLTVHAWKVNGTQGLIDSNDNKPIPFLALQRVLNADETYLYTRILNLVLIFINGFLIYKLTKNPESAFFMVIPLFLNSMWLTVEIIELLFILLGFYFNKHQGLMIGFACIFRPYAVLYSIFLEKKQLYMMILVGIIYVCFIWYFGLFNYYFNRIKTYPFENVGYFDLYAILFLVLMMFIAFSKNRSEFFKWGAVSSIPIFIRPFAHYFIVPYSLFLIEYLKKK